MITNDDNVVELPPYRALLIVDMRNFSGERGRDHARLTEAIPEILYEAFRRCGLARLLHDIPFQGTTGDGYFLGFDSRYVPFLLNPFLPALQEELSYQNSISNRNIRMRVSINVGPMTDSGENSIGDGSGDARIATHRLLDSEPVRDLLTRSADVTCVAAIVSARVFKDAVEQGFTNEDVEYYVPAPVRVKTYQSEAYLRVPSPSGDLLVNGFRPGGTSEVDGSTAQSANSVTEERATCGPVVSVEDGGTFGGVGVVSGDQNAVTAVQGDQHIGDVHHVGQHNTVHYEGDGQSHISGGMRGNITQSFGRRNK